MKIYALVGKSGMGKSYQAMNICNKRGIVALIDDGLFIYENSVLAGVSAKKEETKIGAVKTALFNDFEHAKSVKDKINEINPENILVIGTSDKMVEKIVNRLELPPISETIYIEDITTKAEREIAYKQRHQQGKHVIPAPTPQLKRSFAGYFVDPIQTIKDLAENAAEKIRGSERTVVRPTYSYLGNYYISDKVINDIVWCVKSKREEIKDISKVVANSNPEEMNVNIEVSVVNDKKIFENMRSFQEKVRDEIENMTAFNIINVNINVKEIIF